MKILYTFVENPFLSKYKCFSPWIISFCVEPLAAKKCFAGGLATLYEYGRKCKSGHNSLCGALENTPLFSISFFTGKRLKIRIHFNIFYTAPKKINVLYYFRAWIIIGQKPLSDFGLSYLEFDILTILKLF